MKRTAFPLSYFLFLIAYSLLTSCSTTTKISKQADQLLITDTAISKGFIGISVFDASTNKYLYNYNADKYFVPASNVKLFTLYAGMKYLGDSLVGARYYHYKSSLFIIPTGDPTFLHPDFKFQPLYKLIAANAGKIYISTTNVVNKYGKGWANDDYNYSYMSEINRFPVFGNNLWLSRHQLMQDNIPSDTQRISFNDTLWIKPKLFGNDISRTANNLNSIKISRDIIINRFLIEDVYKGDSLTITQVPFSTNGDKTVVDILRDILKKEILPGTGIGLNAKDTLLYSQPSDSLFKPMMHNSDNFFAEQVLLMSCIQHIKYFKTDLFIDTLLKSDIKDVPQKPKWVDGSGLSRYNLFTPQDFTYILNKMKNEFGMERMKTILATGGEGTLKNYFQKDAGFIYAKTGTLSNNCALSGYIITKKNRLLIFSVLANNYQTGATPVRKAVEQFVEYLRDSY